MKTLFCPCPEMPHVTIFNGKDKSPDAEKIKEHWFDLESVLFCLVERADYSFNVRRLMVGPKKRALARSFWVPYQ